MLLLILVAILAVSARIIKPQNLKKEGKTVFALLLGFCVYSVASTQPLLTEIPNGNLRSGQPTAEELREVLMHSGHIYAVIRLNGDEGNKMTVEEERWICENVMNVKFFHITIDKDDKTVDIDSLSTIAEIMETKGVWIHCQHGYDRTGAAVAFWLARRGWDRESIIQHNMWNDYLKKKGKSYQKYYDVLPPQKCE